MNNELFSPEYLPSIQSNSLQCKASDDQEFYSPIKSTLESETINAINKLIESYNTTKTEILRTAKVISENNLHYTYFNEARMENSENHMFGGVSKSFFNADLPLKILLRSSWRSLLDLLDAFSYMSKKAESDWKGQLDSFNLPKFNADNVFSTIADFAKNAPVYFAQRVESVFAALSNTHVTNSPAGFTSTMIIDKLLFKEGDTNSAKCRALGDLRNIVGVYTGTNSINYKTNYCSNLVYQLFKETGVWHSLDDGALEVKVFKKGTAHVRIHPDIAWKMNSTLAALYPRAIPSRFRKASFSASAKHIPSDLPLTKDIQLSLLEDVKISSIQGYERFIGRKLTPVHTDTTFIVNIFGTHSQQSLENLESLFIGIGGKSVKSGFEFNYDPTSAINKMAISGYALNANDSQFYPSDSEIGDEAASHLDIQDDGEYLEPSAGQGALAKFLPPTSTLVELNAINASILKAKGYSNVIQSDFIQQAEEWFNQNRRFDGILMNPPFKKNQAKEHFKAAFHILKDDGRLVAILPASLKGKQFIDGAVIQYGQVRQNAFENTNVSVVVAHVTKKKISH